MRAKTFTVPFSKVVGEEATELEFGPDDYMVVRPIFGMPAADLRAWVERINALSGEDVSNDVADRLVLDMLDVACIEWHLLDAEGKEIPQPKTPEALTKLPGALAGSLFGFFSTYRGEGPNPTTRS